MSQSSRGCNPFSAEPNPLPPTLPVKNWLLAFVPRRHQREVLLRRLWSPVLELHGQIRECVEVLERPLRTRAAVR